MNVREALEVLSEYCKSVSQSDCCTGNCELYPICKQDELEGAMPFMYLIDKVLNESRR